MSIQHEHTLNPVTALDFYNTPESRLLLLVGEGLFVNVYDTQDSTLLVKCQVFKSQEIHGISVAKDNHDDRGLQLVVWGGDSVVALSDIESIISGSVNSITQYEQHAPDWILDAAIAPSPDEKSCIFVTAHNELYRASLTGERGCLKLKLCGSPSRSILYSGHAVCDSARSFIVAAGTVFGEILVWQHDILDDESGSGRSIILYTLAGHEGSIFGVNLSPPLLDTLGKPTRLLASCSDDRTVRVWDIYNDTVDGLSGVTEAASRLSVRETGFTSDKKDEQHDVSDNRCLAVIMGHSSRIWRVKILISEGSTQTLAEKVIVLSFGEDATCQQWSLKSMQQATPATPNEGRLSKKILSHSITSRLDYTLEQVQAYAFHSGKHIWGSAVSQKKDGDFLCAIGGSDGKVTTFSVSVQGGQNALHDTNNVTRYWPLKESWSMDEIIQLVESRSSRINGDSTTKTYEHADLERGSKFQKEGFNRYAFVSKSKFLFTSTYGRIFAAEINDGITWEELFLPAGHSQNLKSYSIIKGLPDKGTAFLAGAQGIIYNVNEKGGISEVGSVHGKVADMFPILSINKSRNFLIVTVLGSSKATLFSVDRYPKEKVRLIEMSILNLPSAMIVTSAAICHGIILLGSRKGFIAAYHPETGGAAISSLPTQEQELADAITTILTLPRPDHLIETGSHYILTTARNGIYAVFALKFARETSNITSKVNDFTLVPVHTAVPPFGPMVESAWFSTNADGSSSLILYGFRSKSFVVWDATSSRELLTVECGGAYRNYAYSHLDHTSGGVFVYTRASILYLRGQAESSHRVIKEGGHGREIKACAVSPDGKLIATAAEDTAIRLWRYEASTSKKFQCLAVIEKHSAGIQHLKFRNQTAKGGNRKNTDNNLFLFSSAGNEEFFIWALTPSIPTFGVGVLCVGIYQPPDMKTRDLRIMGFDVVAIHESNGLTADDTQKSIAQLNDAAFHITMAMSDSTIRDYIWSRTRGFQVNGAGRYRTNCLTHLRYFNTSAEQKWPYVLTAATDGNLAIFSFQASSSSPSQPLCLTFESSRKIHQNSIKCVDMMSTSDGPSKAADFVIATGGDDGAVAVTILTRRRQLRPTTIMVDAHAAAVTGLTLFWSDVRRGEMGIASSGNDQRVKVWSVAGCLTSQAAGVEESDGGSIHIKEVSDEYTSIADVGDVALIDDACGTKPGGAESQRLVLVVGVGMEIWNIV